MSAIFYCYWSHDTRYRDMAYACAASFNWFRIFVNVREIESKNDWMKNCMARASELATVAHENLDSTVVLLDADLECAAYPEKLNKFTSSADVLVHDKGAHAHRTVRYCPGVLAFAPTRLGRACLNEWARLCSEDPTPTEYLREQAYLFDAIERCRTEGLRVETLPEAYNCVVPVDEKPYLPSPVILHRVASRTLRKAVGGSM